MKTVIDAVNESKGEWIYDEPSIIEQISTGNLSSWRELFDHELNKGNFRLVCNEEQFNQCADEMATNYGTSETYTNYKANYEMINDDMKPVTVPTFTQAMADAKECPQVGAMFMVESVESDSRIIDFEGEEVTVIGLSKSHKENQVITFSHPIYGIGCGVFYPEWVKPLTPPKTDTEKALDSLNEFYQKEAVFTHTSLLEYIKAGHLDFVTFTGES